MSTALVKLNHFADPQSRYLRFRASLAAVQAIRYLAEGLQYLAFSREFAAQMLFFAAALSGKASVGYAVLEKVQRLGKWQTYCRFYSPFMNN